MNSEAKFCYLLLVSTATIIKVLNEEFPRTSLDALINTLTLRVELI
jgi:hypothetical protein